MPEGLIEAFHDRAVNGEAGAPKWLSTGSGQELILHVGQNLELLTQLAPESVVNRILGPLEKICIPGRSVIESYGGEAAHGVIWP